MTSRVMLISPAITAALREARFDDGSPLDPSGLRLARAAAGTLPVARRAWVSPTVRCRGTAEALGLTAAVDEPRLAPLDAGRWRGATLADVGTREPAELARWLTDPDAAPHGGESVRAVCDRVGDWLETAAEADGRTVAVIEPELVRAAVVRALEAPETAFWRTDVPPLTLVELSGRSGRWNVRMGRPVTASPQ
ncbi:MULTISPECIES: histidine phosphatase family protein [unclassified Streptomyces]|uniref:histidine phosphatase family protein n=1 Tax=unclassified Streptomyces TaxID=2593676 RepID=UPI001661ACDB|nr:MULTISPECIES: histidine phosphatase family protein [unclassified Streptomyces]MBD0842190.1 histidine phosphatase family protein [Streptomyces sp. TRM68416]